MTIKGLEDYEVFWDEDTVKVWSRITRKWLSLPECHSPAFHMRVGKETRTFSPGFLRFLMLHPEIEASQIRPSEYGVKFNADGTVLQLYGGKRGRSLLSFRSLDDAVDTVLIMKAVAGGDTKALSKFIADNRAHVTRAVASLLKTTRASVENALAEGEELFIHQLSNANVRKLMPLYSWLCMAVKVTVLAKRNSVSIEQNNLDSTLIMSDTPDFAE